MKKILILMLMGISYAAFASVVPAQKPVIPIAKVSKPDMTLRPETKKIQQLGDTAMNAETVASVGRYRNNVTMENVKSMENMVYLLQNDPNRLFDQIAGHGASEKTGLALSRQKMGEDEMIDYWEQTPSQSEDPSERLMALKTPDLTGTFEDVRASRDALYEMHAKALKQMELSGKEQLGQKQVSIQKPLTVKEIKEMGIDTSRLPKGWEKTVYESEKNFKRYQEQQKREKQAKSEKKAQAKPQPEQTANKPTVPAETQARPKKPIVQKKK